MQSKIDILIDCIDKLRSAIERQMDAPRRVTLEDSLAMLVTVGPNVAEIARRLGINRRVLYRSEFSMFQQALEVARGNKDSSTCSTRGHIRDGRIEAWDSADMDE
jgi:hypothetical protein